VTEQPAEPLVARLDDLSESLARRRAGQSAAARAEELRRAAPLRSLVARVLRVHTDERALRLAADGKRRVAGRLAKLEDDGWFAFHDLPIGGRALDVDHLVIGPGGVYSVTTASLNGRVWATADMVLHDAQPTAYLLETVTQAGRVAECLGAAVAGPVEVRPVLAVFCDDLKLKVQPAGVALVDGITVHRWLERQPVVLDRKQAFAVATAAHRPATWQHEDGQRSSPSG
jgi:hypothetical protein